MRSYNIHAILALFTFLHSTIICQSWPRSIISIENRQLFAGIDNHFRIVAQQSNRVSKEQLSATFQSGFGGHPLEIAEGKGSFWIHPDSVGHVEIRIKLKDTIELKRIPVQPLTAVVRLSSITANEDDKMGVGEFKAQRGIIASVECCDFDAKCEVLGYEVLRISRDHKVARGINKGGNFNENIRAIIDKTVPGDLYLFRRILYKCPGANSPQRLEDLTLEIE